MDKAYPVDTWDWVAEGTVTPALPFRVCVCTRDPRVLAGFPGAEKVCLTPMAGGVLSQRAKQGSYRIPFNTLTPAGKGPIAIFAEIIFGVNFLFFITLAESNTITVTQP